jgi:hypothetical protein
VDGDAPAVGPDVRTPALPEAVSPGRTAAAIFLAWVLPGAGHVLLGRVGRGIAFAALIFGSFGLGLAHDGRLALHDRRQPFLTALQVVANVGVGPADVLARMSVYHEAAYVLPADYGDPRYDHRLGILRHRTESGRSIYGTAYLWTAGLMNLLLLFDVWDIGTGRKT